MVISLIYLAILAIGALSIAVRHGPILLRGRTVLGLNAIAFGLHLLLRPSPALLWLPLFALIVGISWFGAHTWFIFKEDPEGLASAVENRLRRVRVEFSRDQHGLQLQLGNQPASIRFQQLVPGLQALTFRGNWQQNKATVTTRFLGKYFAAVIPRPRFRV